MSKKFLIGIDEAGLGPRLGPLLVSLVLFESDEITQDIVIEKVLSVALSSSAPLDSLQLRLGDSKIIYRGPSGLSHLEKTALSFWYAMQGALPQSLGTWLAVNCENSPPDFSVCPWYGPDPGALHLPSALEEKSLRRSGRFLSRTMKGRGILRFLVKQRLLTAPALNQKIERLGLKSEALIDALASLLRETMDAEDKGTFFIDVDKLGGRTYYSTVLHRIFPLTPIEIRTESPHESSYSLTWRKKRVFIRFLRKGDRRCAHISLASIFSKYSRELCMILFNRFWRERIPHLKPTAGYPLDAARFLEEINATSHHAGMNPLDFTRVK